ncbi:hypothetical protein WQ57_19815 [Mesobacillus campisalis]|uniref:Peptidase S8/S53 domain-containing protein n=1 Tax=Mesobacillus campisalis TaxID=1408103 RepID=A0A0M2SP45_9BACI|nr:S8 family serine peptidase [Mesobacillus campisalis]KKK36334.1 hypothetical protein WQ57_19815 [Mesobacillus campisalis]
MKKWMSGLALAGLLAFSGQAVSAEEPKEYIVVFSSNSINEQSLTQLEESGAEVLQEVPQVGVVSVQSSDPGFIEKAKQDSNIQEVVEDIEISPLEVQMEVDLRAAASPALYSGADLHDKYQWDIKRVTNSGKAWEKNAGSHNVLVAVIDSGVDAFHPDLKENFLYGKAFFNGATEADALRDSGTHGTHVAGSIAANGRVLGVGPELGIASYRVSDHNGRMSWTAILAAVTTAADDGADVANLSLGTYSLMNDAQDRALHLSASRAVRHAQSKGMIIVGANGNDGIDLGKKMLTRQGEGAQWTGPLFDTFTDIPWVISVSSSTNRDTLAYYSNYGNSELAAPGGDYGENWPNAAGDTSLRENEARAYSTIPVSRGSYGWAMGTSMASPKVAAAAALVIAEYPDLKPAQVITRLQQTADDAGITGHDHYFGHGIVNADRALQ